MSQDDPKSKTSDSHGEFQAECNERAGKARQAKSEKQPRQLVISVLDLQVSGYNCFDYKGKL